MIYVIEVMYMHHNPPYMGHMGMDITHKQLTAHYWWPSSEADVRQYVTYLRNLPD